MALQYTHPDHPAAYMRIARVDGHHNLDGSWLFEAVWQAWHSEARRQEEGAACIDNGRFLVEGITPGMTELEKLAAAYAHAATLTDLFPGAIDV